jgi:catechol 2,3-dioxygenase-like lactoylglutathione lyase family enzyme
MQQRPAFHPGPNIAMKMPPGEQERLVTFYRDVIGLEVLAAEAHTTVFRFGAMRLWVDRVEALSQGETWLQIQAEDVAAAAEWLAYHGLPRRDAIERLPEGFEGFWIAAPGGMIHLVAGLPVAAPPAEG